METDSSHSSKEKKAQKPEEKTSPEKPEYIEGEHAAQNVMRGMKALFSAGKLKDEGK